MALAGEYGLVYTRYADDLTFSGDYLPKDEVLVRIHRIIREEGFTMNVKKTRFLSEHENRYIGAVYNPTLPSIWILRLPADWHTT